MSQYHEPVMVKEAIRLLDPKPNENFIDCTLGGGGHAEEILKRNGSGKVLGIDLDQEALNESRDRLKEFKGRMVFVQGNFADLKNIVQENKFTDIGGILLDLGVSYHQLKSPDRGFSYRLEGELDMRLGKKIPVSAKDYIEGISAADLKNILEKYGEVSSAERISQKIIDYRKNRKIASTLDLTRAVLGKKEINQTNVKLISQVFQAIRIAVNNELENLNQALSQALEILRPSGRMVVISYHSLEDRIVKKFFQKEARDCICSDDALQCQCDHKKSLKIITKKPLTASQSEILTNRKSRSAKLRAIIKI